MTDEDRFKAWSGYADISRKWALAMDTKASFVSALNLGLLALLWSGAKIQEGGCLVQWLGAIASVSAAASIFCAVWATLPRESLANIFGHGMRWHESYKPLSYYGFVAQAYGKKDFEKLKEYADTLSHVQLAKEALEQHFVISHAIARKSGFLKIAGFLLILAVSLAIVAVLARLIP